MKTISYITIFHGILFLINALVNLYKQYKYEIPVIQRLTNKYFFYGIPILLGITAIIVGIGVLKRKKYSYYGSIIIYALLIMGLTIEIFSILLNEFSFIILFFGVILFIIYFFILKYIFKYKNYYEI